MYLGELATVMGAEVLAIAGAGEEGYRVVASDSQAAIKRCRNLASGVQKGRSWIDQRVIRAATGGAGWEPMWVKGPNGTAGNEMADRRAKDTVMRGQWMSEPGPATPAGMRQAYPLYQRASHLKWDQDELTRLTYLHTHRGPMRA